MRLCVVFLMWLWGVASLMLFHTLILNLLMLRVCVCVYQHDHVAVHCCSRSSTSCHLEINMFPNG